MVAAQHTPLAQSVAEARQARVQIAQRPLALAFEVIPQGWVDELLFAWLEKGRRLWRNCERYLNTSL
jgi:transposase